MARFAAQMTDHILDPVRGPQVGHRLEYYAPAATGEEWTRGSVISANDLGRKNGLSNLFRHIKHTKNAITSTLCCFNHRLAVPTTTNKNQFFHFVILTLVLPKILVNSFPFYTIYLV